MSFAIEKEQWSRSSQRSSSGHYDERARFYENIGYRCKKCFTACVFTAESQKHTYETLKKYVFWLPSLCDSCQAELVKLKTEERELQAMWNESKETLMNDLKFLQRWLFVVKEIIAAGKGNPGMVNMLAGRIAELSATNPS